MPTVFRTHCRHAPERSTNHGWADSYICTECLADASAYVWYRDEECRGLPRGARIALAGIRWNELIEDLEDWGELEDCDLSEPGGGGSPESQGAIPTSELCDDTTQPLYMTTEPHK